VVVVVVVVVLQAAKKQYGLHHLSSTKHIKLRDSSPRAWVSRWKT
jgi:hypothetical protein